MDNQSEKIKIQMLYFKGLFEYKSHLFFEAHETWEDLWSDYYLEDRKFIQGLIQLSVSFLHLERGNIYGAKSLLNKCESKFIIFSGVHRGINVNKLIHDISNVKIEYTNFTSKINFKWDVIPKLE